MGHYLTSLHRQPVLTIDPRAALAIYGIYASVRVSSNGPLTYDDIVVNNSDKKKTSKKSRSRMLLVYI